MADKKITELTAIDTVSLSDIVPIVDDPLGTPVTKYATIEQIQTAVGGGGASLDMGFELGTTTLKHYRSVLHFVTDSSEIGTLKITLPKAVQSAAFIKIRISGYQYASAASNWSMSVTGYDTASGWIYPHAVIEGAAPFTAVRMGDDGTNGVLLLGGLTTEWKYAQVAITDVQVGLAEPANQDWGTGWAASVIASESGLANLVSASVMSAQKASLSVQPTSVPATDSTANDNWRVASVFTSVMVGAIDLNAGGNGYPGFVQIAHNAIAGLYYNMLLQPLGGYVGIGCTDPQTTLDVAADNIRIRTAKTPASATATGISGQIAWDADYVYVCTATNTWKRAALTTW